MHAESTTSPDSNAITAGFGGTTSDTVIEAEAEADARDLVAVASGVVEALREPTDTEEELVIFAVMVSYVSVRVW
jgi:hypothetical protein